MKDKWRYIVWALFSVLVIALFVFLQQEYRYHFYFIEQNFMFQTSWDYILAQLAVPGGFADLTGEFLIQFFMYPYAGAIITTLLLVLIVLLTNAILRKLNKGYNWLLLACIPALSQLFLHFDFNYKPAGTVALLFMLLTLWGALAVKNDRFRFAYHIVAICCLYWFCGSVYVLYALLALLHEFAIAKSFRYWSLLFIPLVGILGELSLRLALIGEYRLIFLPDMFYHSKLEPKTLINFSWIAMLFLFAIALWLKPIKEKKTILSLAEILLPFAFVLFFTSWGIREYGDQKAQQFCACVTGCP